MKYLKKFNNLSDYEAFKGGGSYILPNVSYIENNSEILFNPILKLKPDTWYVTYDSDDYSKFPFNASYVFSKLKIDGEDIDCSFKTIKKSFSCDSSRVTITNNDESIPDEYLTIAFKPIINYTIKPYLNVNNMDLDNINIHFINYRLAGYLDKYSESLTSAIRNGHIDIDETNNTINVNINFIFNHFGLSFTPNCIVLTNNNYDVIDTVNEYEVVINENSEEIETTITCLASEINLAMDSDSGNLMGTAPSEYFVNNPSSFKLKPLDSNFYDENAYICLLLNVPDMGGVGGIPLPIMAALDMGYCTYNVEENSITATDAFLQMLQSELPYPFCAVLATVNEETGEPTFYDTINEICGSLSINTEIIISNNEINVNEDGQISTPSNYLVYFPTSYKLKPLDENIDVIGKSIVAYCSWGILDTLEVKEDYYNQNTNEIILDGNIINDLYLFGAISGVDLFSIPLGFILCDVSEGFTVIDTINTTNGIYQPIFNYEFKTNGKHNVEFKLLNKNSSPSFTNSSITEITIPEDTNYVHWAMFYNCKSLKKVTIPKNILNLNSIKKDLTYRGFFGNCSSLTSIRCESTTAPSIGNDCFKNISPTGTLYYPAESDYSRWKIALPSGWTYVEF